MGMLGVPLSGILLVREAGNRVSVMLRFCAIQSIEKPKRIASVERHSELGPICNTQ